MYAALSTTCDEPTCLQMKAIFSLPESSDPKNSALNHRSSILPQSSACSGLSSPSSPSLVASNEKKQLGETSVLVLILPAQQRLVLMMRSLVKRRCSWTFLLSKFSSKSRLLPTWSRPITAAGGPRLCSTSVSLSSSSSSYFLLPLCGTVVASLISHPLLPRNPLPRLPQWFQNFSSCCPISYAAAYLL